MDPAYRKAMEALGRPLDARLGSSAPPPAAVERVTLWDPVACVVALLLGLSAGIGIGIGAIALTAGHVVAPGVLSLALSLALSRPLHKSLLPAAAATMLCALIGVPLDVLRFLGSLW